MPKPNLADLLVQELTDCRAKGGDRYPIRLDRLAERLDPPFESAAVLKTVGSKKFNSRAVVAVKGRMDAPVALIGDLSLLAANPLTLEISLQVKGAKGAAPWTSKQLAAVVQKPLKTVFEESLNQRLAAGELPEFAIRVDAGKTVKLHHRNQPPPPKPPKPEVQDAERLLDLLRRMERPGAALAELQDTAGLESAAFKKAVKQPAFAGAVMHVKVKPNDVYVVPNGGEFGLFVTGTLLTRLIAGCERTNAHAFPVKELVALVSGKAQQQAVAGLLSRPDLADLPVGVGCVLFSAGKGGGQNAFFLLEHLRAPRPTSRTMATGSAEASPPHDFMAVFDAAFARIDRGRGSNNFVSLVDLRAALPNVPREVFDSGLLHLRSERRYVLSSDERYDGITPEQQAAAIREEGEFLLHVSRGRQ